MLWIEETNVTSFKICAWFSSRMEQMSGKSTSSVTLTFFSLACKFACNSIKYTCEKTINDRTEYGCWEICFARMDQTVLGLQCFLKVENVRILWLESQIAPNREWCGLNFCITALWLLDYIRSTLTVSL